MVRNKILICKTYHIQPSELDRIQFWEYEYYLAEINDDVEAEKEREMLEQQKYESSGVSGIGGFKMPDLSSISMPSMPSMPSF